ncbi:hypothetical protein CHUAL_005125 [Chamberlinius hualienensis]
MMIVILVAAFAVFNCGKVQAITKCSEITKIPIPPIDVFIKSSPYNYVFGTPMYQCTAKVLTNPPIGNTAIDFFMLSVKGTNVTTFKSVITPDRSGFFGVDCDSGTNITLHIGKIFTAPTGLGVCCFTCNGDAYEQGGCATNNLALFKSEMQAYIDTLKDVPGASNIQEINKTPCFGNDKCPVFY